MRKSFTTFLGLVAIYIVCFFFFASCSENAEPAKSSEKTISGVRITNLAAATSTFDAPTNTYTITVPKGTDVKTIPINFTLPAGATSVPQPGAVQDFTQPVTYTITAADGSTQTIRILVKIAQSSDKAILDFSIPNLTKSAISYDAGTFTYTIKSTYGSDMSAVPVTVKAADGARIEPQSGTICDLSKPLTVKVTAEDGSSQNYTVKTDLSVRLDKIEYMHKANAVPYIMTFEYDAAGRLTKLVETNTNFSYTEAFAKNSRINEFTYDSQDRIVKTTVTINDRTFQEQFQKPYVSLQTWVISYEGTSDRPSKIETESVCGSKNNYVKIPETITFTYNTSGLVESRLFRGGRGCSSPSGTNWTKIDGNTGQKVAYEYQTTSNDALGQKITRSECSTSEGALCQNFSVYQSTNATINPVYNYRAILPSKNLLAILETTEGGFWLSAFFPVSGSNKYGVFDTIAQFTDEGYLKVSGNGYGSTRTFYYK
jgi:hypothetical protein